MDLRELWKILQDLRIPDQFTCFLFAGQEATVRNWTWSNELVENWELTTSRLYIVTCLFN